MKRGNRTALRRDSSASSEAGPFCWSRRELRLFKPVPGCSRPWPQKRPKGKTTRSAACPRGWAGPTATTRRSGGGRVHGPFGRGRRGGASGRTIAPPRGLGVLSSLAGLVAVAAFSYRESQRRSLVLNVTGAHRRLRPGDKPRPEASSHLHGRRLPHRLRPLPVMGQERTPTRHRRCKSRGVAGPRR
jgi:hypothetical protein